MLFVVLAVAYFAVMLILSWRHRHLGGSDADFNVANRSLSLPLAIATVAATSIGASSTVALSREVYRVGLAGLWLELGGVIGLILCGLFVAGRVRDTNTESIAELAGLRFGPVYRRVIAIILIGAEIAWTALLLQATARLVGQAVNVHYVVVLLPVAIVALLYIYLGGQHTVARTDLWQLGLLVVVVWFLLVPATLMEVSSWSDLHPARWLLVPASDAGLDYSIKMFLLFFVPHLVGGDLYAKFLSAKDVATARKSALLAAAVKTMVALGLGVVMLGATLLVPDLSADEQNGALFVAIRTVLGAPFDAVVLVGLLAAFMSSIDSVVLTGTTLMVHDVIGSTDKVDPKLMRSVALIGIMVASAVGAFIVQDFMGILIHGYSFFIGGAAVPILFGLLWPKSATQWGGIATSIVGVAVVITGMVTDLFAVDAIYPALLLSVAVYLACAGFARLTGFGRADATR